MLEVGRSRGDMQGWRLLEHPERHRYDLMSLDSIFYGGAPSAPGNGRGMTEASATVTSHRAEDYLHRPDSCGPPLPVSALLPRNANGKISKKELLDLFAGRADCS